MKAKRWCAALLCLMTFGASSLLASEDPQSQRPATALEWSESMADAFRSIFPGAEQVTASLDANDPGLEANRLGRLYVGVSAVELHGLKYDQILLDLKDVAFETSGRSLLISSIGSSSATARISAQNLQEAFQKAYPRLQLSKVTVENDRIDLWGVYRRDALIPLRATMHLWGNYEPQDGVASFVVENGTNNNAVVSLAAVARAIEKAAPVIRMNDLAVKLNVSSLEIAPGTLTIKAASQLQ